MVVKYHLMREVGGEEPSYAEVVNTQLLDDHRGMKTVTDTL